MLEVTNISKNSIRINGIIVKPLQSYRFPANMPDDVRAQINYLSSLGLVRISAVEETTNKKSNKKNK